MSEWNQAKIPDMEPIIKQVLGQMHTEYENGVMRAVQSYGFAVDKDRLLQALTDARAFYEEGYMAAMTSTNLLEKMTEAFGAVVWYNGYLDFFQKLEAELLAKNDRYENYGCPIPVDGWNTDLHCLWMILVGMFGDWGTSIRGGWIEDLKGAAEFLREALAEHNEGDEDDA